MKRGCAAEGDQRARPKVFAAFDRVHARCIGHVLVDHLADAERGMLAREIELGADAVGNGLPCAIAVEHHLAAGERRRIDAPQRHVGIGHGRFAAAAPVADRPRFRAGAPRTDRDAAERVDARDRAAAGADLDHLDHGYAERQTAAFGEAIDPRHLEHPRGLGARFVDKADLRRGAAHVEGDDLI